MLVYHSPHLAWPSLREPGHWHCSCPRVQGEARVKFRREARIAYCMGCGAEIAYPDGRKLAIGVALNRLGGI